MTHREQIKEALRGIVGVKLVTTAWPEKFDTLPCILLSLASEQGADFRDDEEYLTTVQWYVRVFAAKEDVVLRIAAAAYKEMKKLGYIRDGRWEIPDGRLHRVDFRFTKTSYSERIE